MRCAVLKRLSFAGVEHVGGDMFENVPKGDALFMKVRKFWSIHNDGCWGNIVVFNFKKERNLSFYQTPFLFGFII